MNVFAPTLAFSRMTRFRSVAIGARSWSWITQHPGIDDSSNLVFPDRPPWTRQPSSGNVFVPLLRRASETWPQALWSSSTFRTLLASSATDSFCGAKLSRDNLRNRSAPEAATFQVQKVHARVAGVLPGGIHRVRSQGLQLRDA